VTTKAVSFLDTMGADLSTLGVTVSAAEDGPVSMTDEEYRARAIGKMDVEMRKKYGSKGGKFNFKVVVRGDSSTGKSTLLRRLRGGTFVPEYTPTAEIKTAHIPWQARSSPEDNVMLEVWDVVDRARKRDVSESLTLAHKGDAEAGQHTFPLDATMVDVYQNCHAAVFLIDPSKKWTYEYVRRELPLVPTHVPTCILINFRDYPASKRAIRSEEVEADCEAVFSGRPFRPFVVETSLLNCYGLSALSTFLHIPFLCLKRATLERALALNTAGVVQAQEALQAVKGDKYEEYERRVERATSGARSDTAGHRLDGDGETAPTAPEPGTGAKDANATAPATAEEAAITWEKLSKTTLGEAPILLGSAAVSGLITGVTAVASATPADIAANVSSSVSGLASLETFGLASKKKGHFDATEREKVAPQFSHLAGRGGASAAAFGGEDIDDGDLSGPRAGMSGGGEHPDVGPVDDDFFAASPRKGDDGDAASGDARDWDEDSEDDDTEEDDGAPNADGDTKTKRATPKNPVVRWDDDDESSDDDGVSDREEKEKGASEPLDGVASDADAETADETAEGASVPIGVVRQISAEDPFFGAAVREKRPVSSPLDPALANAARAAEVDLDPSAIAASLGSGSGSANLADSYETVDDSADFLGKTVSSALRLSGDGQDSSGKKKKEKKSKKKEKSFSGKTNDERSSSGSLPDRPDALFASAEKKEKKKKKKKKKGGSDEGEKPKKPSKKVRDWDESESD
jgi:GTPase SAR1 family protein